MPSVTFNGIEYKLLPYNLFIQPVRANTQIRINEYCNAWTVLNQGNDVITVNQNILIYPGTIGTNNGESTAMGGNFLEIYRGIIDISFAGVGNAPLAIVTQKIYLMNYNAENI